MLRYPREHARADIDSVVKGKDEVRPAGPGKDSVRTGLALDGPPEAEQSGKHSARFG